MNTIKLIIQRTLNGLDIDYTSEPINEREFEASGILYDERKEINQLDCSVVLSITNTAESKVYSYINNRVLDVSKRKGFYAIRLIVPRNVRIPHVYKVLQKIAQNYDQHLESNTINALNYDGILQELNANTQPLGMLLGNTIYKVTCYTFIDFAEQSDSVLNSFKLELFHKTYLLDEIDKDSESSLRDAGMKDFKAMYGHIKDITIENPESVLSGLWINDIRLDYSQIKTSTFKLACLSTDQIHYTSILNNNKKTLLSNNHLVLQRPQPAPRPTYKHRSSRGSSSSGPYWLALLALVVGVAGGYFGGQYFDFPYFKRTVLKPAEVLVQEPTHHFHLTINNSNSNAFLLETDTAASDTLNKYYFKYDPKQPTWRLVQKDKGANEKELTRTELNSLLKNDTGMVDLFIEELKRFSAISVKDSLPSGLPKVTRQSEKKSGTESTSYEKAASTTKNGVESKGAVNNKTTNTSPEA
ncbi:hypothetical protein FAZ19_09890 [Sphingobacterium alkalisoli]|uniref:Uncharacterized protein n=1 Tax=Sphingobacterium alkalisoli TaxID=1874115 RepID=A0A4U0H1I2_9SPHI|nr:hypothetical protein [Sphingobacterium alkalisoli]TJY65447.1 hypothetical protein FAZ19_09890 [Sphingobacterium alkalisoli]GGH20411.1 hypothetical protein GCM10011418_25580 [Sphingobacterium alkalisoli]